MIDQPTNNFELPDTFWRVSAKAFIYDNDNRLLVFMDKDHEWEVPGGGWEHDETFEQCIERELAEEIGAGVTAIDKHAALFYKGLTMKGYPKICIAAKVTLDDSIIKPSGDDLIEARFVDKSELLKLSFQYGESEIKDCVSQIWS